MTTALTEHELKIFRGLKSPASVQEFLDALEYSDEARYRCPRSVIRDRKAHCYDGAVFAAAALSFLACRPRIVEILPNDRDDDHIIAVYRRNARWGALAKSNFVGLRSREPVYHSLRELLMSYFEAYYNVARERTMRGYTAPVDPGRSGGRSWMTDDAAMDRIADALDKTKKYSILTSVMQRTLTPVDKRSAAAGLLGSKPSGLYKP